MTKNSELALNRLKQLQNDVASVTTAKLRAILSYMLDDKENLTSFDLIQHNMEVEKLALLVQNAGNIKSANQIRSLNLAVTTQTAPIWTDRNAFRNFGSEPAYPEIRRNDRRSFV